MEALVVQQEPMVEHTEEQTIKTTGDLEGANHQLDKATVSARRARKLKWWTLLVVVLIICILALVLGIIFGVVKK
jgi:syntaxin 1B/2/3